MELSRSVVAAAVLIFGASLGILLLWRGHKSTSQKKSKNRTRKMVPRIQSREQVKQMNWERAGRVTKVFVYPVKSCKGISVESADAELRGLVYKTARDRSFMFTTEKGTMLTARMVPSCVLMEVNFENNILTLNFPGMKEMQVDVNEVEKNRVKVRATVWGEETFGLDCGREVSLWLQKALHRNCKMIYQADLPANRVSKHPLEELKEQCTLLRDDDQSFYADFSGYMLMTTESVADLQSRVSSKVAVEDLRPNILVEGTKKPYDEDEWKYLKIGDTVFRNVVPCARCIFTTISAETGKKNPNMEPLRTLKTYRCAEGSTDPFFGINLGLDLAGKVRVGDEVFITRSEIF